MGPSRLCCACPASVDHSADCSQCPSPLTKALTHLGGYWADRAGHCCVRMAVRTMGNPHDDYQQSPHRLYAFIQLAFTSPVEHSVALIAIPPSHSIPVSRSVRHLIRPSSDADETLTIGRNPRSLSDRQQGVVQSPRLLQTRPKPTQHSTLRSDARASANPEQR